MGLQDHIDLASAEATAGSQYLGVVTVKQAVAKNITQINVVVEGASVDDLRYAWERDGVSTPITPLGLLTPAAGPLPDGRVADAFSTPTTAGEYILHVALPNGPEVRIPVRMG